MDDLLLLPFELVDKSRKSAEEYLRQCRDQAAWFKARGIDPGDWSQVYPVLKRSWKAYGIPSALDRFREQSRSET